MNMRRLPNNAHNRITGLVRTWGLEGYQHNELQALSEMSYLEGMRDGRAECLAVMVEWHNRRERDDK